MTPRLAARIAVLAGLLALTLGGLLATSCDRKPRLVPPSADSLAIRSDSLGILSRMAGQMWADGRNDEAATVSARVLRMRLANVPQANWADFSRTLLDSLGVAAEVAGQGPVLAVNQFSRIEQGRTWPYLFWREGRDVRVQVIEGRGMQLVDATARTFTGDQAGDSSQVAVLWARKAGLGEQPLLVTWRHAAGGRWDLGQTLGPDSLGGTGNGHFRDSTLVTQTWRATPYFDENCSSCPHVMHERTFRWGAQGFERVDDRVLTTPYTVFTELIIALVNGDNETALRRLADPSLVAFARRLDWHDPARGRWRAEPSTDPRATSIVFFRGRADAYRVTFQSRGEEWVVLGFEAVNRSAE